MNRSQAIHDALLELGQSMEGDVMIDGLHRMVYATDASVYQEHPLAVVCPASPLDLKQLIELAARFSIGLIPRAAGTSLAGQVVGDGIVVDISRYFTSILEVDPEQGWVRVQPGVIRDELNQELKKFGLLFGPETSTSNRAMLGGMLGNNSCGSNSIVYGSTRDNVLEIRGFLSDGTEIVLGPVESEEALTHPVLKSTVQRLQEPGTCEAIQAGYPKSEVSRRNTGYAVDRLVESRWFMGEGEPLNFCHLIAGSEGTLFFATEIKLKCHPQPPPECGLFCPHFESLGQALQAVQIIMQHAKGTKATVYACELIDRWVLEGAGRNLTQQKNLEFVEGEPAALLIVAIRDHDRQNIDALAVTFRDRLKDQGLGYAFPLLFDDSVRQVWEVRKAGLGVVANVVGDDKPTTLIEDTAVSVEDLPAYIQKVNQLLQEKYDVQCVHYAHVGAGEVHLRPILNLKTAEGLSKFRQIASDVNEIVKEFRGSISGEHGDGRLRGEFIREMVGEQNYELLRQIKAIWDPQGIFNPGKIVDAPPMDEKLRYSPERRTRELTTTFDFSEQGGLQRAAELCSGSGDCRKTELTGGVMCPSYMATRNEVDSTRARANVLRQVLSDERLMDPLNDKRLTQALDLCLSCKACKSECPSNVDMARMKSEVQHQRMLDGGLSRRAKFFADFSRLNQLASLFPWLSNRLLRPGGVSRWVKRRYGIHSDRSLPPLSSRSLRRWFKRHQVFGDAGKHGRVFLFCDEFTNYLDAEVGISAVELLERLGFEVVIPNHRESGRAAISQGMLDHAKACAVENVNCFSTAMRPDDVLIGLEPSAILTFRDEYPALVGQNLQTQARQLSEQVLMFDEFVSGLLSQHKISGEVFTLRAETIYLHGHCHQKALASMRDTIRMLQLPRNYQVKMIPAGCCGMAGAFGYEEEHYDISMKIGELVLFPAVRRVESHQLLAAAGTSCRHQILDGTGRIARHPVQILRDAWVG